MIKKFFKHKVIKTQCEGQGYSENMYNIFDRNLKGYKPNNLLDVGCSSGEKTISIGKYFDLKPDHLWGVDNDEICIDRCKEVFNVKKILFITDFGEPQFSF